MSNNTIKRYKPGKGHTSITLPSLRDLTLESSILDRFGWDKSKLNMEGLRDTSADVVERVEQGESFLREVFMDCYNSKNKPVSEIKEGDSWAVEMWNQCKELPEYPALKERCSGDRFNAALSAQCLGESLLDVLPENEPQVGDAQARAKEAEQLNKILQELEGDEEATAEELEELRERVKSLQNQAANAQAQAQALSQAIASNKGLARKLREAMRSSMKRANQDIEDVEQGMSALGCGSERNTNTTKDGREWMGIARKLRSSSSTLKKILKLAGRMQNICSAKQATRSDQAKNELHSVEQGNNPSRILSSEFALLANTETKPEFLRRYVDKSLLQFALRGKEKKSRGPIVVLIDTSGSMSGAPILWAKAFAMAMLTRARKENRPFAVHLFDTVIQKSLYHTKKNPIEPTALIKMLEESPAGGGTDLSQVMERALRDIQEGERNGLKRADLILLSDGNVSIDHVSLSYLQHHQDKSGLNVIGCFVGMGTLESGVFSEIPKAKNFNLNEILIDELAEDQALSAAFLS